MGDSRYSTRKLRDQPDYAKARSLSGPIDDEVTAPPWLAGSVELTGMHSPLCGFYHCVVPTRVGLLVRAVHQDREMTEALGINTRTTI